MELLPHFSHEKHPFILKNLPKQDHSGYGGDGDGDGGGHSDSDSDGGGGGDGGGYGDSGGDGGGNRELLDHICKGCNEQISLYDEPYCYRCEECDYDLHKLCAEAPLTIQHHSHYEHPLHLCDRSKILREILPTRCCRDDWPTGLCYYCDSCEFLVDIICATAGERKVYNPHHHHRLSRFRTPFWAKCNACGIRNEAVFLQCTMCLDFWLHEYCALLPKQILIQQVDPGGDNRYHHAHPLTIEYGLLDRHARHFPDCRVCKAEIDRDLWIYSCERCRYFVHVNCNNIKHEDLDFMALSERVLPPNVGDGPLVLKLPLGDEFHSLMELVVSNYNLELFLSNYDSDANYIAPIVHDHPLILIDHRDDKSNIDEPTTSNILLHNPMKRIKLLCNACVRPIAELPFYKCREQQCNDFSLHKQCAELPSKLLRRHKHPLVLLPNVPNFFGIFRCKICYNQSNGFAYGCVQCEYYIDVRCAFMPVSIKHEAHPEHVLHLQEWERSLNCRGCRYTYFRWLYFCDECKFRLCSSCAQLPGTLRHKYDRHPLRLMYLPPEDHISQYFCDICEEEVEMDPNTWFYHCAECNQQMEVNCSSSASFGLKCGGFITIDLHPHPLTFTEWRAESNIRCNDCDKSISYGFRCVECRYNLHWECVHQYILGIKVLELTLCRSNCCT